MNAQRYLSRTPIQIVYGFQACGNSIYIKRDDLLPFSFGGNKVRIAEAFLSDMKARGCNAMVMYGDRHSNLCRVLANMCHIEGFPCIMVVTTSAGDTGEISFNQTITSLFDVRMLPCQKNAIADAVDTAMKTLSSEGHTPYYIYGNRLGTGNEGVAASAYASAYCEIKEQERELGLDFDRIVLPYGTGSTQGGLVAGELACGDVRPIDGISISSRSKDRAISILKKTVLSFFSQRGVGLPSEETVRRLLNLHCEYNLGGYGIYNQEVLRVARHMLEENGIPLDPIYTAKAFLGMLKLFEALDVHGENVLFVHTGGLPLFFDSIRKGEDKC